MPHPKGGYKTSKGKCPGTTTVAGRFKDSGGLLWWAYDQGKAAERGEISNLHEKRDQAGDAGTLAHLMTENHIKGNDPQPTLEQWPHEIPDMLYSQAKQGFENYLRWAKNTNIRILHQEIELVSEKYQYGGCPDAIGIDTDDNLCLLDWKTSNSVYVDHILQLAAYRNLWEENNPDKPLVGGFHLCRFSKEHADFHHHYWSELDDAWEQFKLFRKAYDLDKKLKKRL